MNHQTPPPTRAPTVQSGFSVSDTKQQPRIALTTREKEALLWSAKGKSSWEISRIFNCTEAGVNYHFSNTRQHQWQERHPLQSGRKRMQGKNSFSVHQAP
ncbi:LuxR C-terminal-related transcriptional regulator [Pseudomonas sp. SDO5591_S426]